jgi:PEP-CTERM motif
MKISKLPLLAAILPLAATLFLVPAPVHADTYQIFNLGTDNGFNVIDIDTSGVVIIFNTFTSNYLTVDHSVVVNTTSTLPSLTYDNGAACSVPSGFAARPGGKVICNNGRTGFGSAFNPNGDPGGVYTGPPSDLTRVDPSGTDDLALLNSSGDFAWDDGLQDGIFEAIDLTTDTPEPGSLLLVGTGCVSLLGVLRRKAVLK